jgi:DNA-binding transcriptional MocR family regulator
MCYIKIEIICGISEMSRRSEPSLQMATPPGGTWVQIDRAALERAAELTLRHPRARALLDLIIARSGRHNALVASQATLAQLLGCTDRTVRTALSVLRAGNWIEVRQLGPTGTANAYIVNDRVAWSGPRNGIRYSMFSAAVLISDAEQPDRTDLGALPPLEQLPVMYPGERQLPTGPGLPPPSEPSLPGLEPDLPARQFDIEDFTS